MNYMVYMCIIIWTFFSILIFINYIGRESKAYDLRNILIKVSML
jgi:hypothetical protein